MFSKIIYILICVYNFCIHVYVRVCMYTFVTVCVIYATDNICIMIAILARYLYFISAVYISFWVAA